MAPTHDPLATGPQRGPRRGEPSAPPAHRVQSAGRGQPGRGRYQFSILSMLLVMLVAGVFGAAAARMDAARQPDGGVGSRVSFVFFTLLAPMLLAIILSVTRRVLQLLARRS